MTEAAEPCWLRVVDMAWSGYAPVQISEIMGISRHSVSAYLSRARKAGVEAPYFPSKSSEDVSGKRFISIPVDSDILEDLITETESRGQSVGSLIEEILTVVVRDGLVDAVLDSDPE